MTPSPVPESTLQILTNERLRLLGWGYYLTGGISLMFTLFMFGYAALFGAFALLPMADWAPPAAGSGAEGSFDDGEGGETQPAGGDQSSAGPPAAVFRLFAGGMLVLALLALVFSLLTLYAGRCIHRRQRRIFVNVIAAFHVIQIPYGLLLAILTFMVINSERAKAQFDAPAQPVPPLPA
jgi:hypothetical protein